MDGDNRDVWRSPDGRYRLVACVSEGADGLATAYTPQVWMMGRWRSARPGELGGLVQAVAAADGRGCTRGESRMMRYLTLVFAHLLADYPLQGQFLSNTKGRNPITLVSHAGIWTGTIMTAERLLGYRPTTADALTLFGVHVAADFAKARPVGIYKRLSPLGVGLALDQAIHLAQLAVYVASKEWAG